MIKKIVFFVFIYNLFFQVFAQLLPSNSIGIITDTIKDGYEIDIISENENILYKDGKIIKQTNITFDGNIKVKTETDENNKTEIYKYSSDGNLIEYKDKDDNIETYTFDLNNRVISSTLKNKIGEVINAQVYYRDINSGKLLCVKNNDKYSFFKDEDISTYFVTGVNDNYNIYQTFFSNTTITSNDKNTKKINTKINEDGSFVIENDNKTIIYSSDGLLLENDGKKYSYNSDKVLSAIEYTENNFKVIEHYDNSFLKSKDYYEHGFIVKRIIYENDNIINELFENGKIYAKIVYDGSGEKVIEIEYF